MLALTSFYSGTSFQHRAHFARRLTATLLRSETEEPQAGYKAGQGFGKKKQVEVEAPATPATLQSGSTEITTTQVMEIPKNLYETPRMRREAELDEKIRKLKEEEDLVAEDTSVGAVPELVANRMASRIAVFFGIPVFGGKHTFRAVC